MRKIVSIILAVMLISSFAPIAFAAPETGTLTITKYMMDRVPVGGIAPNGQKITDGSLDAYEPVKDIEFVIVQVRPAADQQAAASDASKIYCKDDGLYYEVIGSPISRTTDEDGIALFDHVGLQDDENPTLGLPLGIYYVTEQPSSKVADPAAPFFVSIPTVLEGTDGGDDIYLYDVYAYPKNEDIGISKTIGGYSAGEGWPRPYSVMGDGLGMGIGDKVLYGISVKVPTDIAEAQSYKVIDIFSSGLRFDRIESVNGYGAGMESITSYNTVLKDLGGKVSGEEGFVSDGGTLTIDFTDLEELSEFHTIQIQVWFQVTENASLTSAIPNKAELKYTNRYGTEKTRESKEPKLYTGGIKLFKHDSVIKDLGLEGATFKLVPKLSDDFEADLAARNGSYMTGATQDFFQYTISATSDANGMFEFKGLPYGTVVDGVFVPSPTDYWLVEVEQPDGYRLPAKPSVITISQTSWTVTAVDPIRIGNVKGFNFPLTGGTGTLMLTLVGLGLAGVALALNRASRKEDGSMAQ